MATAVVTIVSPEANPEVWPEEAAADKLARGYITEEAWLEQCAAKAAQEHQAWVQSPETLQERFRMLRVARDAKIAETDYLLRADYPISPEKLEAVKLYRQALRDLPGQQGAPWDGGGDATPWPVRP